MTERNSNSPFIITERPSNWQIAARYGAIWAISGFAFSLISFLTDTDPSIPTTSLSWKLLYMAAGLAIAAWCITMAIKTYRDDHLGGIINYNTGFSTSLKTSLVAGLAGGTLNLVYTQLINTGYMDTIIEATRTQMEKQGLNDDQIEKGIAMTKMFIGPLPTFVIAIVFTIVMGMIIGLFAAAAIKKE